MLEYIILGEKALSEQNWKEAQSHFEKSLAIDRKNAEAYLGLLMASDKVQAKNIETFRRRFIKRDFLEEDNYRYAKEYASKELKAKLDKLEQERAIYIKEKEEAKQAALVTMRAEREGLKEKIAELETDTLMLEKNRQIDSLQKELDTLYRSLIYIPEIHTKAYWEYKIYSNNGMIQTLHFWQKKQKEHYLEQNREYQKELDKIDAQIESIEADITERIEEVNTQLRTLMTEQAELIENQRLVSKEEKDRAERLLPGLREQLRKKKSDINFIDYDIVEMGSYIQQAGTKEKEPVEWLVIEERGNRKLLISRYCIDCHQFNPKHTRFTWATSEIRTWLNSAFKNTCFTEEEQSRIVTTHLSTPDNETYDTPGGEDTDDKLFFLSLDEGAKYFKSNNERAADSTPYAKQQGAYVYAGASWWWLRSPGANRKFAADVHISGAVFPLGDFGISFLHGVRPAMWVEFPED
ncbi:MAG: DUF6273 domain-containing protein [Clostridia bacterium]|nr:DUF6273 domain-containing protein [Clostridia bacterium]